LPLGQIARLPTMTRDRAAAIRKKVLATGYHEREPMSAEMYATTGMPEELRIPLVARALEKDTHPASGLARLFQHQLPVPTTLIDDAIGVDARRWLAEAGIVTETADRVRSPFRLFIADGVFIFSDAPTPHADAVMHPGPTTLELMSLLPPKLGGSFLDVGTGPGSLALLGASLGSARAIGTDINERAAALARFNAAFNDLRLEVRLGDLFEPVADDRFDWIVAQPPYVTHPEAEPGVAFLHGGAMGDELAMRLLAEVPTHLRPNGMAIVLFDSPVRRGSALHERVRDVIGPRLDVLVLSELGISPDRQALGYAALADPTYGARYAEAAVRYRDHLERLQITDVTHSLVFVRAPAREGRSGWTSALTVGAFPKTWEEVRVFVNSIDLSSGGDDVIGAARVRPRSGATVVIERKPGAERDGEVRSIRFERPGLALDRELTQAGAVIFDLLAAESSVASTVDRFATAMGRPAADVRGLVISFVRDCLTRGLLVPD
jgi:SAM-dependent methyltransferase